MAYEVKSVRRLKGRITDSNIAKVVLSNGVELNVTYDRLNHNLIIHEWYNVDQAELHTLKAGLTSYFEEIIAKEDPAA